MKAQRAVQATATLAIAAALVACGGKATTPKTTTEEKPKTEQTQTTTEKKDTPATTTATDPADVAATVTKAIEGETGAGEKVTGVTYENNVITVTVDLSGGDTSLLSPKELAESRADSISAAILTAVDDNAWEEITIDFGSAGSITYNHSHVQGNSYGRFMDADYTYKVFNG